MSLPLSLEAEPADEIANAPPGTANESGRANRRTQLHLRACELWPGTGSREEIDAHFNAMPARYWLRVNEAELLADIAAIHAFLGRLDSHHAASPHVAVAWQHFSESSFTRVRVCSWDRQGLLAKVAAAFGAMRINIIRADVYTRTDDLVLDVFDVCEANGRQVTDAGCLDSLAFLIEGALCEPPRFASVWSTQFHKTLPGMNWIKPQVDFDLSCSDNSTVIQLETSDRQGFLYDILQALNLCNLNVEQAVINTAEGIVRDVFHVTDSNGIKVSDPTRLQQIRETVISAIVA